MEKLGNLPVRESRATEKGQDSESNAKKPTAELSRSDSTGTSWPYSWTTTLAPTQGRPDLSTKRYLKPFAREKCEAWWLGIPTDFTGALPNSEEFVTATETHHLQVQTVTAGMVDLSTASGRMIARMLGAAAQHEVDHARERMKRAKAQMAVDGKYRGGPRPYGYENGGILVREDEARVVRGIHEGNTCRAVARGRST